MDFIRNLFSGGYTYLYPYHENHAYVNFIEKDSQILVLNNDGIDFGTRRFKMHQANSSFDYNLFGEKHTMNFSQVIPFYDIAQNPKNNFIGVSRLKSLEEEVNQIWLANKAIDNQIKLSGNIMVSPDSHKENELSLGLDKPIVNSTGRTHKHDIEDKLNNPAILFGKTFTVSSVALKAINLAESLKDYDYNTKFKQEAGRVMLNLYSIPRKLQNIITTSELKSDKEGEDIDLYEKVVIPIADNLAKSMNSVYSKLTKTYIKIDYSHLSVFQEKKSAAEDKRHDKNEKVTNYVVKLLEKELIDKPEAIKILKDEKVI